MFKIPLFGLSSVFYTSCTKKEPYLFIGKTHKFKNCLNLMTLEEGCQFLCDDNNKGYAVTADGADKVTITSGKIKVEGDYYNLSAAMQSKNSEELPV